MKLFKQLSVFIIVAMVISSAFCAEEDNPPPATEAPFLAPLSYDDAPIPLAFFFIKINPPNGSAPHDYTVSLDLSKIYEKKTIKDYQLHVGDRFTVKVDFDAYPHSNFMQVVRFHGHTPVFVNRELPKQSGNWYLEWSQRHPGTWGIFGHIENHGWSDWWNRRTLLKIVDRSEQAPAYVTYEAMAAGEVGCYYSHQLDTKRTSYASRLPKEVATKSN